MAYLPEDLLAAIHARAHRYDRDNSFCNQDLEALRAAGYLGAHVPTALGGAGLSLPDLAAEQTRLGAAAPATALAVNMHQVWVGVARMLHDRGDHSLDFLLTETLAGEVFAFGISEAGNDEVLFGSSTQAVPDGAGGFRFHGTKIFTSLAPAWTRLGVHGTDSSSAEPAIVFGFVTREGTQTKNDWNALGMRATQSRTTALDGAHAPAHAVVRRLPVGPNGDPFTLAIFACFEILVSAVYLGIGQRALDLAVEAVNARTSSQSGARLAQDPQIRWRLAEAAIVLDGAATSIRMLATDVAEQVDHGDAWFGALAGLKVRTVRAARAAVETAIEITGGRAYGADHELSRLYRDVLAGLFHPSDENSAHRTVSSALLGPLE